MRTRALAKEDEATERENVVQCSKHLRLYTKREGCQLCIDEKQARRLLQQSANKGKR